MPFFSIDNIASFLDKQNIPYKCKITLTGIDGHKFYNGTETDKAYNKAKQIVTQFRLQKGKPVAYVAKEMAERTCDLLKKKVSSSTALQTLIRNILNQRERLTLKLL